MGDFFGVAYFIALDLINIDSLCEFVRLTESDYWDLMLTSDIWNNWGSHLWDYTSIAKDIASSNE